MTRDLVLEFGFSAPLARGAGGALSRASLLLGRMLDEAHLPYASVETSSTPWRIALRVCQLAEHQSVRDDQVLGPPVRVAFETSGAPMQAAMNFAARAGVALTELFVVERPSGALVAARQKDLGQPAHAVLLGLLSSFCERLFARSSSSYDSVVTLPKPSWLLAVHGNDPLPFSWEGLEAGSITYGTHGSGPPVRLDCASNYEQRLAAEGVMVSLSVRVALLRERVAEIETAVDAHLVALPPALAAAALWLEQPVPALVPIEPRMLTLPEWVLCAALEKASGFFLLIGRASRLLPQVVGVFDVGESPEVVARARGLAMELEQAEACYVADSERRFSHFVAELGEHSFYPRLGSFADKTERLSHLVRDLGASARLSGRIVQESLVAASICAADRATKMVSRYPELEGLAGREYALEQGVRPSSAELLNEFHAPRHVGGPIPNTPAAALLALADRLDRLVGYWSVGAMPAGRLDPLDSRGDSLGLLRILIDYSWPLSIEEMSKTAFAGYAALTLDLDETETVRKLGGYLRHRLRGLLLTSYPRDVVNPCFEAGADEPSELAARATAYSSIPEGDRAAIAAAFPRLDAVLARVPGTPEADAAFRATCDEMIPVSRQFVVTLQAAREAGNFVAGYAHIVEFVQRLSPLVEGALSFQVPTLTLSWLNEVQRRASDWLRFEGLARSTPLPLGHERSR